MELWVRSHDKTNLYKIDNINMDDYDYTLYSQLSWGQVELGQYKSKERALEILDEIHQRLIDLQTLNYTNDYRFSKGRNLDCVFIMPEE